MGRVRTLVGISIFWLPLSVLSDGFASLVVPVQASLISDSSSAATVVGLITFAGLLAGMLVQPLAGALSDRLYPYFGRRGMLLIGAACIVAGLVAFGSWPGLAGLLFAFIVLMLAVSFAQAAQQGFIPDLVGRDWRGRAAGAKGLADVGGGFIGFVLLGSLLLSGGSRTAIAALALFVVAAAVATVIAVREPDRQARSAAPRVSLRAAYQLDFAQSGPFVAATVARFFFLLGTYVVGRFLLLFVAERLALEPGAAAAAAGGLLAALTLVAALAALPAGWLADRFGRGRLMVAGALVSAAGALLLVGAASAEMILLFGAVMALGSAAFTTANWALTADLAAGSGAGRLLGIANFGTAGAAAAAGLFGPLADVGRAAWPELGYGSVFLLALVPFALSMLVARTFVESNNVHLPPVAEERSSA